MRRASNQFSNNMSVEDMEIVLEDDPETAGPTSNVNLNPDEDEEIDEEKPETEEEEVDWESDENPYKQKYSASSKEVNENLLPKIKGFEDTSKKDQSRIEELQNEIQVLSNKLKEEKPEAFDNHNLKKQLDTTSQKLAELLEKSFLDEFIGSVPLAKDYREALRSQARANPTVSLEQIWNSFFKEGAEAKAKLAEAQKGKQKKSKPETGEGSSTTEPSQNKVFGSPYTQAEFDKLPVKKRREYLIKAGVSI